MTVRELASRAFVACAALLLVGSTAADAQDPAWPQAVERLAGEKNLAQACASILKTFAGDAPMARVQGERLYARAQADTDGLVRLIVADLASEGAPAERPELRHLLEAVPRQRQALCDHVDAAVGREVAEQLGGTAAALLAQGTSDSAGSIAELAVRVRQAYREADPAARAAIVARLEAVRWLPYAAVPAA
jgi:hypothetical protein